MPLTFLAESHTDIIEKLETELKYVDSSFSVGYLSNLTITRLTDAYNMITEALSEYKVDEVYGSWLGKPEFVRDSILQEYIATLIDSKNNAMDQETLYIGESYYCDVQKNNGILTGYRAIITEDNISKWIPILEAEGAYKVMQVLRDGNEQDFRTLYVGMANGRPDGLRNISFAHITESSKKAMANMVEYCEHRWGDTAWPWETPAPEKLKLIIEHREEKRMRNLTEMQHGFKNILREFDEMQMDQFDMLSAAKDMLKRVDSMITDLGKLSSSGIEVMAQAKASGHEDFNPIQNALGEPLNSAVESLTNLKASLTTTMHEIAGSNSDMNGDEGMTPMNKMGKKPDHRDLADVDIAGDEHERPVKEF